MSVLITARSPVLGLALAMLPPLLLLGVVCLRRGLTGPAALVAGAIVGLCLACTHGTALLEARIETDCAEKPIEIVGVIDSLPVLAITHRGDIRQSVRLQVVDVAPAECVGLRNVYLSYYGDETLLPGERWSYTARLKQPWGAANPGSSSFQAWFAQQGIDAVGSASVGQRIAEARDDPSLSAMINTQRQRISSAIEQLNLSPDVTGVLRALTVADKNGIKDDVWQLFRDLGISHLLVISGLHVGLVAGLGVIAGGLAARIARSAGRWVDWLPALFGIVPAMLYSALAGFSLPTQRATLMLSVFLVCGALGRPVGAERRLLWAGCCVLALNPLAGIGSGFWLSFGAVLALLWFGRWQPSSLPLWHRLVMTHCYMSLAMVPLTALFFGGASIVSAAANFVFIPLIGFLVVPLALIGALAYLCDWQAHQFLWSLAGLPLEWLLPVVQGSIERAPVSVFLPANVDMAAFLLGVIAVLLLGLRSASISRSFACLLLCVLVLPSRPNHPVPGHSLTLAVVDVGQGTAVTLTAGGRTLVYDTGGGDPLGRNAATESLVPYLKHFGVRSLDTLIISHGDTDHSAGVGALLETFDVKRVRYGVGVHASTGGLPCIAGESWRWPEGPRFTVLSPAGFAGLSTNNGSCVLQIAVGDYRILLTGDIEKNHEREIAVYWRHMLRSDWLLVPHHGSGTSSSHVLLKTVQPDVAVVSAAYKNPFGHPRADVVARLRQYDALLHKTADAGALEFYLDEAGLQRTLRFRDGWLPYWM